MPALATAPARFPAPRALPAAVRHAAAESTLQFEWLLGERQFFTFKQLEHITGMSDSFIEKLWEQREHAAHISGHEFNAGRKGVRNSKRVARAFVVRLLVCSARYTSEEKLTSYLSCLREFSRAELLQIAAAAHAQAQK